MSVGRKNLAYPNARVKRMNHATETVLVALAFAVLLVCDWRYQLRTFRLGTVMLSLVVLFFAEPSYVPAARRVSVAPPEERITQLHGRPISEYLSGVTTMYEAIGEVDAARANVRLIALGVLVWLACSPVLLRARGPSAGDAYGR
jgi:hypothetical protein